MPPRADMRASSRDELADRIDAEIVRYGKGVDSFADQLGCTRSRLISWRKSRAAPGETYVEKQPPPVVPPSPIAFTSTPGRPDRSGEHDRGMCPRGQATDTGS